MFISQITDDNIDRLSRMVPDRIRHHKFPIFFSVINKYLCGGIWRVCKYTVPYLSFICYAYHTLVFFGQITLFFSYFNLCFNWRNMFDF